ncbi:cytochrome P450 [Sciscionella sediminilitoris]|uniref:cytochrome P450 n=1 Tax=Sciscionella sediminilitoris TaxID=1445613 RepID=UPI0004DF39FF|nr:cytochrome P450 [Sciscionella sp. SE31]
MTATQDTALQALFDPARRADPYPGYRSLRENSPILEAADALFVLTRQTDCAAVMRDNRFGHAEPDQALALRRSPDELPESLLDEHGRPVRSFLVQNPPEHTRLRKLVSKAFTRGTVAELAPRIEEITARLLDGILERGEPFDLIDELAYPLPVAVISELLGIPDADREQFVRWSHAMARGLDPDFLMPEGLREKQLAARLEFGEYLRSLAAERRAHPGEDLISGLLAVPGLAEHDLIATCILLLIAGHETTVNLIGNGTLALLRHPDQLALLRAEPERAEAAVEELLRYDSPVQMTMRLAREDAEVGEVPIPRGAAMILLVGSANRDPDVFAEPENFDIARNPAKHLAFGQGVHFCLGAPLARLEGRIVLRTLLERVPGLRLAGTPAWKDNIVLRGLRELPVAVR